MEYLKKYGFKDFEIEEILNNNSSNVIDNLILNQDNVISIIDYLIEIGLEENTIREIFLYQVGLFFKTKNEIKSSFDEYELESIVKSLNYDVNNIELIDFI